MNDVIVRVGEAEEVPVVIGEQTYIKGDKGNTFFPNVSENGDLSWSNDGGLPNPPTVNIKGPQGDPGNYTKPASGIPKSDLASDVQASLGKADTALQEHQDITGKADKVQNATNGNFAGLDASGNLTDSGHKSSDYAASDLGITGASVGDLVRISAVSNGKPTAFTKVPLNAIICNRNLLNNWYFVGGGSQQGGGQFPINQRGQTSYSNVGYGIDRWLNNSSSMPVAVNSSCITLSPQNSDPQTFYQVLPPDSIPDGTQYTISILSNYGLSSFSAVAPTNAVINIKSQAQTILYTVFYQRSSNSFRIYNTNTEPLQIYAVKLELGPEQTLAHQKNGAWVLNEIPDYGQELAKCQRYYQVRTGWHYLCKSGSADNQQVSWDFPVEMRATPTITITNGNNIEEILFDATKGSVMFYKNSDVTTRLGVYRFTASADL